MLEYHPKIFGKKCTIMRFFMIYTAPLLSFFVFALNLIHFEYASLTSEKHEEKYVYPWWMDGIGLFMATLSIWLVPGYVLYDWLRDKKKLPEWLVVNDGIPNDGCSSVESFGEKTNLKELVFDDCDV